MGLFGTKASRQAAKNRLKAKQTAKKTKRAIKKATGTRKIDRLIANKGFVVLAPYKGLMRKLLAKRGHPIEASATIKQVSLLFYAVLIQNKNHFEYFRYAALSNTNHLEEGDKELITDLATSSAPNIVQAIIKFFQNALKKKDAGANLSEEDRIINDEQDKIEDKSDKEIEAETDKEDNDKDRDGFFARIWRSLFGKKEHFRRRIDRRNQKPKPLVNKQGGAAKIISPEYMTNSSESGANVIHAYGYSQDYARRVKAQSESAGTLAPLIQGKIGSVKEYRGGVKRVRTSTGWHNV